MANMAYCRFHNTKQDMEQCLDALTDQDIPSEAERVEAKAMFKDVLVYLMNEGVIEDFDEVVLVALIDSCKREGA